MRNKLWVAPSGCQPKKSLTVRAWAERAKRFWPWINEPEELWFGRAELIMNSLRKKLVGRFRQRINEPAAQGKTGNALEVSGLASRCARRVGGMITPSLNHS